MDCRPFAQGRIAASLQYRATAIRAGSQADPPTTTSENPMRLSCADILAGRAKPDTDVTVAGWVRTRRDSKAGLSFIHVSDGSGFHPVQVVAPGTLSNY